MNAQTTDRTISNFIRALRNADIRVSTAETLDALSAVELVGYEDRDYLKRTLSLVLPKTEDEKVTFDACFDQFFAFQDVRGEADEGWLAILAMPNKTARTVATAKAAEQVATDRPSPVASAKRAKARVKTRTTCLRKRKKKTSALAR